LEFSLLKIVRLESELAATQEELASARLRLRAAEDLEIKYQLLLNQCSHESSRMGNRGDEDKMSELFTLKLQERDTVWRERMAEVERGEAKRMEKEQDVFVQRIKKLMREKEGLEEALAEVRREGMRGREEDSRLMRESLMEKNKERQ
jgi:hypothetical protein